MKNAGYFALWLIRGGGGRPSVTRVRGGRGSHGRSQIFERELFFTFDEAFEPKRESHFYSLVLEFFLSYSISYPIVRHAPAFLHSFLFLVTVVKGIGP